MGLPETWLGMLALAVLVSAIFGGAVTALLLITNRNAPMDLGLVHGRMGVAGILLLMITAYIGTETGLSIKPALGAFMLTAAGGATLYYLIRRKGILSKTVILIHGSLAITAISILLFGLPV